jgi:hypothetical protein
VLALPREVHEANLRSSYRLVIPYSLTPPVCLLAEHEQKLDLMQRDYVGLSFLDPTRQQQDLLHAVILKMQLFISARGLT